MKNVITTIPADFFDGWKPKPANGSDARILRFMGMHDGDTIRQFNREHGYVDASGDFSDRPDIPGKPWFWIVTTIAGHPKGITPGESVCFMVHKGRIIGYFDLVAVGTKKEFYWVPEDEMEKRNGDHQCIALANWHPGDYGPMTGFQGWRYTELQP